MGLTEENTIGEECGRWEKDKNPKCKEKKQLWEVIFTPKQFLKRGKHNAIHAPRAIRWPSFGSSPPSLSGTGSKQQMLRVSHLTHVHCAFDSWKHSPALIFHLSFGSMLHTLKKRLTKSCQLHVVTGLTQVCVILSTTANTDKDAFSLSTCHLGRVNQELSEISDSHLK